MPHDFRSLQLAFAACIRDPDNHPVPEDVSPRRMALYRELFFHNVAGNLHDAFPLLRTALGASSWQRLVHDFFANHRCRTPQFSRLPEELVDFLRSPPRGLPPWTQELARYEWIELELSLAEDATPTMDLDPDGDLLANAPVLSPQMRLHTFDYPVHHAGPEFPPEPSGPFHLLAYRKSDVSVHWLELNPATARLLTLIQSTGPTSGRSLLRLLATTTEGVSVETVVTGGQQVLGELRRIGVIWGTVHPNDRGEQ